MYIIEMTAVIKMKILSILSIFVLDMLLTASSRGQVICEPCHTEELKRAAMDKALASIGCDRVDCGKEVINFCHYAAISKWSLILNIQVRNLLLYSISCLQGTARIGSKKPSSLLC